MLVNVYLHLYYENFVEKGRLSGSVTVGGVATVDIRHDDSFHSPVVQDRLRLVTKEKIYIIVSPGQPPC